MTFWQLLNNHWDAVSGAGGFVLVLLWFYGDDLIDAWKENCKSKNRPRRRRIEID